MAWLDSGIQILPVVPLNDGQQPITRKSRTLPGLEVAAVAYMKFKTQYLEFDRNSTHDAAVYTIPQQASRS